MKPSKSEIKKAIAGLGTIALAVFSSGVGATPLLQLYIEGATYNSPSETWSTGDDGSFILWVMGNVAGPGGKGSLFDVRLTAAVRSGESGSITLTPTQSNLLTDPSVPALPTLIGKSADGAFPMLGDGSQLASHGEYDIGTSFYEWSLGDLTRKDSPVGDMVTGPASSFVKKSGQLNAYTVNIFGHTDVHFDAFGYYQTSSKSGKKTLITNRYVFAPFSHDAEWISPVPEPETYAMLLAGLGLVGLARRRNGQRG